MLKKFLTPLMALAITASALASAPVAQLIKKVKPGVVAVYRTDRRTGEEVDLVVAADAVRRRRPFADAVDGEDSRFSERRRVEGAGGVGDVVAHALHALARARVGARKPLFS